MLLFLMGVDFGSLLLIVLLLAIIGQLTFRITRRLLRKKLKNSSSTTVNMASRITSFIVSPVIVFGTMAVIVYSSIHNAPRESGEDIVRNHYRMLDEQLGDDLKVGMSKAQVTEIFGDTDTTQSVMMYDLSLPDADEKFILRITFEGEKLTSFARNNH